MKIGFIGLGKMGAGLVAQLAEKGHEVLAWNRSEHPLKNVESVEEMVKGLVAGERIIWLMLPAGSIVDEFLQLLKPLLIKGDLLIDGGNSRYSDTLRRGIELREMGIGYMDVGRVS